VFSALMTIIASTITLLIGIFFNRIFENKPRLITYFGHVSAGKIRPQQQSELDVFTLSVVIKNVGQKPTTNIRVNHNPLIIDIHSMISVYPPNRYNIEKIPGGGEEIYFDRLLAGEEIMITYVYFPPLRFDQVVTQVKSDECIAKRVNVLLNRQYPAWFLNLLRVLLFVGFVSTVYLIFLFIRALIHCLSCVV
jgi:hypothetical protein